MIEKNPQNVGLIFELKLQIYNTVSFRQLIEITGIKKCYPLIILFLPRINRL